MRDGSPSEKKSARALHGHMLFLPLPFDERSAALIMGVKSYLLLDSTRVCNVHLMTSPKNMVPFLRERTYLTLARLGACPLCHRPQQAKTGPGIPTNRPQTMGPSHLFAFGRSTRWAKGVLALGP